MAAYASALHEAGTGLGRIDTEAGWSGEAADAFRQRFHGHPQRFLDAAACFQEAADALSGYVPVLAWAQQQAGEAIRLWAAGEHRAATATLANAQGQLSAAAGSAAAAIARAGEQAPPAPGFWSEVGDFFSGLGHDAAHLGASALDTLASAGSAALQHPLDDLGLIGGTLLAGVSAAGDGLGVVLDATGVGAVAGVPLNAVSTAGVAAGAGLMLASAGDLARHAAGDDSAGSGQSAGPSGQGGGDPGAAKLARQLKVLENSRIFQYRNLTVSEYVSRFLKGSVWQVLGKEYADMTVEDSLRTGASTVRKLLTDSRFMK